MKNLILFSAAFLCLHLTAFSQWTQMTDIPTARCFHSSCTSDGKIYVIGGTTSTSNTGPSVGTMEVYDPGIDDWVTKTDMPTSRVEFGACAVNGKIYAIGGATNHGASPLGMVEEYDPLTDLWDVNKTPMLTPRKGAAYGVIDNRIYVAGGTAVSNFTASNKLEIYDPATDTWDTKAEMPIAIYAPQGAVLNDTFYVAGGLLGAAPWTGQKIVQRYDPISDIWEQIADLDSGRVGHTANAVSGKIYAIGGDRQSPIVRSVEEYDSDSNTWDKISETPIVMTVFAASVFDNKIYTFSGSLTGIFPDLTPTSDVYCFDPSSVGVETQNNHIPGEFVLNQNFPNPFNPSTKIMYSVPQISIISIKIFDILGNEIETLVNKEQPAGTYEITWYAGNLPGGVYIYKLRAVDPSTGSGQVFIQTKKMILLK